MLKRRGDGRYGLMARHAQVGFCHKILENDVRMGTNDSHPLFPKTYVT